jgi:hypothetical protein
LVLNYDSFVTTEHHVEPASATGVASRLLAVLPLGMLLAACGGSSDGGPLPVDYATISGTNAAAIASDVLKSAGAGPRLGEYTSLLALNGSLSTPPASGASAAATVGLRRMSALMAPGRRAAASAPIAPTTSPCSVAGTITLSGDISSTQTLTLGDTLKFEFAACDDGIIVVSGSFEMTITAFSGDLAAGTFALGVDATLVDFYVTENGAPTDSIDGAVSLDLDFTSTPSFGLVLDADALDVGGATSTTAFENLSLSETSDGVTGAYTLQFSGRARSSAFVDAVDFETTTALESADGGNPYLGRVQISGAGGTSLTIVVLDSTMVRLEVDENGDGVTDVSIDTTWDALI